MGCWDVYCLACGLPCYSQSEEIIEDINDEEIVRKIKKVIKQTAYLNNVTFLTVDDRVVRNCKEVNCNNTFISPRGEEFVQSVGGAKQHYHMRGLFIHTSCWNWVKTTYGVGLKYSDLPVARLHTEKAGNASEPIHGINYGPITAYWWQMFDYASMAKNGDEYMVDRNDPKNIARMKKIVMQFKIKNDPKRIGPSVSATFFRDGAVRVGKNCNFWTKKNGKWQEIKEDIVKKKYVVRNPNPQLLKYVIDVPFIGEQNNIPVMKKKVVQSQIGNTYTIDMVMTSKYVAIVDKKFIK